jgi:PPM family protein phosphatase
MIDFAALSDIGLNRPDNQDAFFLPDASSTSAAAPVIALADGMGGFALGGVASSLALKTLMDIYSSYLVGTPDGALKRGFEAANAAVRAECERLGVTQMGTTLIAAAIHGNTLHIAHMGDSRAYLIRADKATCLTQDHSVVGDLLRMNVIKAWQVRKHDRRSMLTRAIGLTLFAQPDIFSLRLLPGDRLVLCTDGCWGVVEDEEFAQIANHAASSADLCQALVDIALARGSEDNISVVAAHIRQIPGLPLRNKTRGSWMGSLFDRGN